MTKEELHELFEYRDGNLYWKINRVTKKCIGKKAGSKCKNGYEHIQINYKYIYSHRAIFLYHHGYLPKILDHINGIRDDNRIENLELWSKYQPSGQRVEDKVKYALEILEQYAPEKLAGNA